MTTMLASIPEAFGATTDPDMLTASPKGPWYFHVTLSTALAVAAYFPATRLMASGGIRLPLSLTVMDRPPAKQAGAAEAARLRAARKESEIACIVFLDCLETADSLSRRPSPVSTQDHEDIPGHWTTYQLLALQS